MFPALRRIAFVLSGAATLACGTTTATCDCLPAASVKLVNARAGQGAVDLIVDGEPVVSGVAGGASSAVANVPAGQRQVTIRSGSTVLAQISPTLEAGRLTAIVFTESGTNAFIVPLDTGHTARSDRANVRIVGSGVSTSSELVLLDVWFNDATTPTLSLDPTVYGFGPFQYFAAGDVRVRFTRHGQTDVVAEVTFAAALGKAYEVVLRREGAAFSASVVTEP